MPLTILANRVARGDGAGRPAIWLACSGVVLAVIIAAAASFLILDLRDRALADTKRQLTSLLVVLSDQADNALQAIDLVQTSIIDDVLNAGVKDEAGFAEYASSYSMHVSLRSQVISLPQVSATTLVDARGKLLNFSRFWPIPEVNVSDRDYFQALTTDPSLRSFISSPVQSRGDGSWTIFVVRRLSAPDGTFLGLVLGAIELDYFKDIYRRSLPAEGFMVSLFRPDGVLLVHHPSEDNAIGRPFPLLSQATAGVSGSDVWQGVSPLDGQEKLIATRMLPHYPVMLSVSRTLSVSLAQWRSQAFVLGASALALALSAAGIGNLGFRLMRTVGSLARAREARAAAEERERGERELRQHYARFGVAMDNMIQGLCMFDGDGRLVVANQRQADLFGLPAPPCPGSDLAAALHGATAVGQLSLPEARRAGAGLRFLRRARVPRSLEWKLTDGRCLTVRSCPVASGGWLLTCEDVTQHRRAEEQAAFLIHHDALTRLPNRALLHKRMSDELRKVERGGACAVQLVTVELLKELGGATDRGVTDLVVREVGERLLRCARAGDTVARLGDDVFAVLQVGLDYAVAAAAAAALANRLQEEISLPCLVDGREVTLSASIGIALAPADGEDAATLLWEANVALQDDPTTGGVRFFEPNMSHRLQTRRTMETELRHALERGEFELFYQPLVQLATRRVVGFEALLRWNHPERGQVPPDEFIPISEQLGLIVPIGEWVLRTACLEAASWPDGLKVAVNLSSVQVGVPSIVATVAAALEQSGLHPRRLELEITETVLLRDTDETLATLRQLRGLGATIAMDDFGTGYSALGYLRKFPFDKVKIDRSFVGDLGHSAGAIAIVHAVTGLCAELGMISLAEGVETEEQLAILAGEQCVEVQGYLFSRPQPASAIPGLLAQGRFTQIASPVEIPR